MQKRILAALFLIICLHHIARGQKPTVVSADKESGAMTDIITLKGSDFGTDPTKLKIFFGGAQGEINSVSNQLIEVRTPSGATYDNISVTNTTAGLTGYA